jgi:NodT family efflux transporter outer membrane factor (OMF) lipoprotein
MNRSLLLLPLLLLAGCAVGPDYQAPADPDQKAYDLATLPAAEIAGVPSPGVTAGPVPPDWWTLLRNPALDSTEKQALADNNTLAAAKASLRAAQQVVLENTAAWWPQIDLSAGVQRNGSGGFTAAGGGTSSNYLSFGPSASYMLDLFGATARAVEQTQAQADYQRWQVEAARLTLVGGVATEALAIAAARLQIATAEDILASDRKDLSMVQTQFQVGKAARTDVLTAQSQLVGDQTQLATLKQQLSVARHALAVLLSRAPSDWTPPDFSIDDFTMPDNLPNSLPSELVHQRPDITSAEAQLHAASAAIGVAAAQQYPQITLSAAITQQSVSPGTLFESANNLWNVGANLAQPIFHGGALEAQRQAAVETYEAQLATYRQTVITAFGQVADSLRALEHDAELLADAKTALDISGSSLALQRSSYQVGKTSLLQLLTAERAYAQAKQSMATAKVQQLTDAVQLFIALGVTQ